MEYDFSGWATRNNIRCSDGRTTRKAAFKDNYGRQVPLVWNHSHNAPSNLLGNALLENRDAGVYAYCTFNDTANPPNAKSFVTTVNIHNLSISPNPRKHDRRNIVHAMTS